MLWLRRAGGLDLDLGYGVAADNAGNVYMAGFFASSSIGFDGTTLTNSGGRDIFVAKLGFDIVPTLNASIANQQIVLSWPAAAVGFSLEYATDIPSSSWSGISTTSSLLGSNNVVTLPISAPARFFRLHRP